MSGASLAVFRITFGVAMVVNALLYLPRLVDQYYVQPTFRVAYGPFGFVEALPGVGMYLVYLVIIVAGGLIALGRWYRSAMATLFLSHTYVFLLDATFFQNHEYLISLLSFVMVFLPANAMWSLDARVRPEVASTMVPAWTVWVLRFQIGVPYFFGGIAKLNADWLAGEPLRTWLAGRTDIEPVSSIMANSGFVWFAVFGAIALDLLAVPLLSWRRTRIPMYSALVTFHLVNAWTFGLYVFPWLMIAATTIFFAPDWPLGAKAAVLSRDKPDAVDDRQVPLDVTSLPRGTAGRQRPMVLTGCLVIWAVVQIVVPLRPLAFSGNASWTDEGHQFSWHMMLRHKSGTLEFELRDGDERWTIDPSDHLTADQLPDVATQPAHLVQFAHYLSEIHDGAAVHATTSVSLNGRRPQPLVDPELDLASISANWWGHADWILPLIEALPRASALPLPDQLD